MPLYVALAALEMAVARRRGATAYGNYGLADTVGNLSAGLGEVVIGLFIGPLLIALYDWAFARLALFHWPTGPMWTLASWLAAFLLADLGYYLYHRVGHRCAALWAIHGVHHQSERFNLTIALRHPWFSDFYAPIFYAPLPLLGIPPEQFFIAITLISFYALTIHSRLFDRPSLGIFVTPRTHILHHARNPRYIGKNLGAMFTIWDRLFGTHVEPDPADPPRLGTPAGYQSHDGALAQWLFPAALLHTLRQTRSLRDRVRLLFSRPGWLPPGVEPPPMFYRRPARAESEIPLRTSLYVVGQFALTVGLALDVLWLRDRHPKALLIAAAALILWSLSTLGGLLDGRRAAPAQERLRLGATAALGAALLASGRYWGLGGLLLVGALGGGYLLRRLADSVPGGLAEGAQQGATLDERPQKLTQELL